MLKRFILVAFVALIPSLAQAEYWGDLPDGGGTIYRTFDTFDTDGILVTLTSGGIEFYEDDNTTPITSAETFTVDRFGTGKHVVAIDTDNAAFEAGKHYSAKIVAGATADGVAVGGVEVAWFTVGANATAPANFEDMAIEVTTGRVQIQDGTDPGQIATTSGAIDTVTTLTQLTAATTEPTSPPSATAGFIDKVNWLFLIARNKKTVTDALIQYFADDGSTVVGEKDLTDNGTVFTEAEAAAP